MNDNVVDTFQFIFPTVCEHDTLGIIGLIQVCSDVCETFANWEYVQPFGSVAPIAEMQARVVLDVLSGRSKLPSKVFNPSVKLFNQYLPGEATWAHEEETCRDGSEVLEEPKAYYPGQSFFKNTMLIYFPRLITFHTWTNCHPTLDAFRPIGEYSHIYPFQC